MLTARYTASTHLYQKPIDMHTVVHNVRTKHTCDQVIIIIVSSEGLNSLLRVCVFVYHVSIYTRNSWHETQLDFTHQRYDGSPSAWEEIIWLVNARSAHAHTFVFSQSLARSLALTSDKHTYVEAHMYCRHLRHISHWWGKAIMVRFITIIINTTWLLNSTREWKKETKRNETK